MFVSAKTVERSGFDFKLHKTLSSPTYRIFSVLFTRYVAADPKLYFEIQYYNLYSREAIEIFKSEVDLLFKIIQSDDERRYIEYVEKMKPYFERDGDECALSQRLVEWIGEQP